MASHHYTDPDGIEWTHPGERRDCLAPDCEVLVQVGWYCWRCKNVNPTACRSDCAPVHVPQTWVKDMEAALQGREEGQFDGDDAGAILRIVWDWIEDANNGFGSDADDLAFALKRAGYGPPEGRDG